MATEKNITTEQRVLMTISPTTKAGQPAKLDGEASVTLVSGEGEFTQHESESNKFWLSGNEPGDVHFLVEGDADLGAGKETISDTVVLHVTSPNADNLGVSLGEPEAKV